MNIFFRKINSLKIIKDCIKCEKIKNRIIYITHKYHKNYDLFFNIIYIFHLIIFLLNLNNILALYSNIILF